MTGWDAPGFTVAFEKVDFYDSVSDQHSEPVSAFIQIKAGDMTSSCFFPPGLLGNLAASESIFRVGTRRKGRALDVGLATEPVAGSEQFSPRAVCSYVVWPALPQAPQLVPAETQAAAVPQSVVGPLLSNQVNRKALAVWHTNGLL